MTHVLRMLVPAVLSLIASVVLAADPPAGQRATPIIGDLADAKGFGSMYVVPGDAIERVDGQLPVVEHRGRKAVRIRPTTPDVLWQLGLARNWTRFYIEDYLPDGRLEIDITADPAGGGFDIGFAEDRKGTGDIGVRVDASTYGKLTAQWQTISIPLADFDKVRPEGMRWDELIKVLVYAHDPKQTLFIGGLRFVTTAPEKAYPPIKLNQIGYRPAMPKIARVSAASTAFQVVDAASGRPVVSGSATPHVSDDPATGDDVWLADFSSLQTPGSYKLVVEGVGTSDPFVIGEDVYDRLLVDVQRFYYLQRCNTALDPAFAGEQAHEACHMGDANLPTVDGSKRVDVTGGWHDAGDNNKYPAFLPSVVPMLALAYAANPSAFADRQNNIPESGNGIPDFLDEIRYELDWLLKMQLPDGPDAGMFYDRLHQSAAKPEDPNPGRLQEPRRLLPPTLDATAASVSSLAMGAAVMADTPELGASAQRYLAAARTGWDVLIQREPDALRNLQAAAALTYATGEKAYADAAARLYAIALPDDTQSWRVYDSFRSESWGPGVLAMATGEKVPAALGDRARKQVKASADVMVEKIAADGYGSPLWILGHYCWSSNQALGMHGAVALTANRFHPDPRYVAIGQDAFNYLLGVNAMSMSFVTGYGTRWTEAFHSIYGNSSPAFLPMPAGFVPGGVNAIDSRGISNFPARSYRPDPNNWTINEPAIYYNAPMVYLAAEFAAGPGVGK